MCNDQNITKTIQTDMSKKTTTTDKCLKVWSENTLKWRYIPKDPEYFKNKYYEYAGPQICKCCGTVVRTQMARHTRSNKCRLVKDAVLVNTKKLQDEK